MLARTLLAAFIGGIFWTSVTQAVEPRVFAPGVETVIPPSVSPDETVSIHPMVEIRAQQDLIWSPELSTPSRTLHNTTERSRFSRDIWCLEFSFKPLRMIRLETPGAKRPHKLVWYMVYKVRNTGKMLQPTENVEEAKLEVKEVASGPVRFMPHFVLQGQDVAPTGGKLYRAYLDQLIPGALEPIHQREVPGRKLLSNVEMSQKKLAEGEEAWGVAMWEDIDPEMDFFSIFIKGLSNAYQWTDPEGAFKAGDPPGKGREFVRKTLQLNFWRPGDRFMQHESEVTYGVPAGKGSLYGVDEGVAYQWIYR